MANRPQAHVRIDFADGRSLGPGKIALLEWIERTGSLSGAGRALGMSYRRAWLLLHSVNDSFGEAAVEFMVGGRDGGGAKVTDFGRRLIADYRAFEKSVDELASARFGDLRPARDAPAPDPVSRRPLARSLAPVRRGGRSSR
jgi:molybdate transport system regulatory protein